MIAQRESVIVFPKVLLTHARKQVKSGEWLKTTRRRHCLLLQQNRKEFEILSCACLVETCRGKLNGSRESPSERKTITRQISFRSRVESFCVMLKMNGLENVQVDDFILVFKKLRTIFESIKIQFNVQVVNSPSNLQFPISPFFLSLAKNQIKLPTSSPHGDYGVRSEIKMPFIQFT